MISPRRRARAIGMMSGGLDSTLAAALLLRQGVEVLGVNFYTGFCVTEQHRRLGVPGRDGKACRNEALRAGADLAFEVRLLDISEEYYGMITNPRYGYGSAANPCIDCRVFMLARARAIMEEEGADFVFTGEVVGQRPKSQRRPVIDLIEKACGLEGRLLRPLSAKLLPETLAEREGLVDRERLLGIWGRGRQQQIALAAELGITDFPQPAGGCCFLADQNYAYKFFDFVGHNRGRRIAHEDVILLGTGRHFRLSEDCKLVVGRNEHENRVIRQHGARGRWLLLPVGIPGPAAILDGEAAPELLERAAGIVARYSDLPDPKGEARIACTKDGEERVLSARAAAPASLDAVRIVPAL